MKWFMIFEDIPIAMQMNISLQVAIVPIQKQMEAGRMPPRRKSTG